MNVCVVGIGLDGKRGLHPDASARIHGATLLIGSDRHLSYFSDHPAEKHVLQSVQTAITVIRNHLQSTVHSTSKGENPLRQPLVVVLASGDPLFYGIGRLLLQEFPPNEITIYPHISSIQLAFSRIKVPWHDAHLISAHGRSLQNLHHALEKSVDKIAVLTDSYSSPDAIARLIQALDRPHNYKIWVCENLGSDAERVQSYTVENLANRSPDDFAALNVVVLLRQTVDESPEWDPSDLPVVGIPDSCFASFSDRPGLISKRETRLLILGELAPKPKSIIWDIGAGTGAVSIELARLCPSSTIYAIEKTSAGMTLIQKNMNRFQVGTIQPIHGDAPKALDMLPKPNHVFVGGSGGELVAILTRCFEKLMPAGTMVVALATLERQTDALHWIIADAVQPYIADYHLLSCQVSRSLPVGPLTRMAPLNPVNLLTILKTCTAQTPPKVS